MLNFLENEIARFQAALGVFLLAGLTASFANPFVFIAVVVVFHLIAAFFAMRLSQDDRVPGAFLLAFFTFAVLSIGLSRPLLQAPNFFFPLILSAIMLFAGFTVVFRVFLMKSKINAKALGFTNGFAVVQVSAGLHHDLKPGVYAVSCKKPLAASKGSGVVLVLKKSFFSNSIIIGVEAEEEQGKVKTKRK